MKKLWLLSLLLLTACDGEVNPQSWPLEQAKYTYEIDGWGANPDIYEFTPKSNPNYSCILAVSGVDELKTMFCFPNSTLEGL
jgi:hypothetical protein